MKLTSSFRVPAPPDQVLAHFLDPDSMRVCVPGCEELERPDPAHYRGRLVNEIAHVRFSAGFTADITESVPVTDTGDPARVHAVLRGEDRRLGSSIKVDASLGVRPAADPSASDVDWDLEIALWGKLGRLGESIVGRRSREVERQFVERFTAVCAAGPPGPGNAEVRPGATSTTPARVPETAAAARTVAPPRLRPRPAPAVSLGAAGAATVVASRRGPVAVVPEIVPVPAVRVRPAAVVRSRLAATRAAAVDVGGRFAERAAEWVAARATRFLEHRRASESDGGVR
ncbi:MAG: hypothetical protein EKK42_16410 [Pseudonocardiaceae bacterium]|nr:MAG: hypothetical protein EKK42_16410 [Pseudonocardiaceae bacterium]